MATDKSGNITANIGVGASIPFRLRNNGVARDLSSAKLFFVIENGTATPLEVVPDLDSEDTTLAYVNVTPEQLVSLGDKTRRYDLIEVVDGKRCLHLTAMFSTIGFAIPGLSA